MPTVAVQSLSHDSWLGRLQYPPSVQTDAVWGHFVMLFIFQTGLLGGIATLPARPIVSTFQAVVSYLPPECCLTEEYRSRLSSTTFLPMIKARNNTRTLCRHAIHSKHPRVVGGTHRL